MPLISVVVPCYNQAQYLDECLQSVLDQTYQDWECIIVNDGSPDNTEEVAKKWVAKDARFKYLLKENGGVASARNYGIEKSSSDWILPLDGDDKIGKDYLALSKPKIDEGYDLIYCEGEYFGKQSGVIVLPEYTFEEMLLHNIIFCSAIFKKRQNPIYDESMIHGLEDWEFWIAYLQNKNAKVYKIPSIQFFYRIKDKSRNLEINENIINFTATRKYVFNKHYLKYFDTFGDFFTIKSRLDSLEKERDFYKKAYLSKRYKVGDKIVSFLNFFLNKK